MLLTSESWWHIATYSFIPVELKQINVELWMVVRFNELIKYLCGLLLFCRIDLCPVSSGWSYFWNRNNWQVCKHQRPTSDFSLLLQYTVKLTGNENEEVINWKCCFDDTQFLELFFKEIYDIWLGEFGSWGSQGYLPKTGLTVYSLCIGSCAWTSCGVNKNNYVKVLSWAKDSFSLEVLFYQA